MQSLNVAHVNVRSLLGNFDRVQEHVSCNNYDIIGISETWLGEDSVSSAVDLDQYNFFQQNRIDRRGGGVGLYVKDTFRCRLLCSKILDHIEYICIEVQLRSKNIIICVIYRPPSASLVTFFEDIEELLSDLYARFDNIVCMGDFNIDMLRDSSPSTNLENVFLAFEMQQLVGEPTHFTRTSMALLDLVFTNLESVSTSVVDANIADHCVTCVRLELQAPESTPISFRYRSLGRIDLLQFQTDLENLPLNNIADIVSIDEKIDFLNSCILGLFEKHAPLKNFRKITNYTYAPWITENIKFLQKLRNKALQKFKKTKNPSDYDYYKQLRNYTTGAIRTEKRVFLRTKLHNCNTREKWKELRRLNVTGNKKTKIPTNLDNVDEINNFFVSSIVDNVPRREVLDFYDSHTFPITTDKLSFELTTEYDIMNILNSIKTKASGIDEINITLIQLCCPFIIPYITHIVNECLASSYFPVLWKQAQVVPLPKVKMPSEYGQLRSISILPTFSKLLERTMEKQITHFLNVNNILPLKQSGFRRGYSCESALADITDDVFRAYDKGDITLLVLLDFSKAFDTISHEILLAILRYIGFSDSSLHLLASYLSDRAQRVVLDGRCSSPLTLHRGVPQGSILGPLLFIVYTIIFRLYLQYCSSHFYVDDTQIYYSFPEGEIHLAEERVNADLKSFSGVARDHLLQLNPKKSSVIVFGSDAQISHVKQTIRIKLDDEYLPFSNHGKSLGLIIDSKMRFREHVTSKLRVAYCNLKMIYSHRTYLSQDIKKMLCDTLILSHFNFCSSVFMPCLDGLDRYRIQKVQNSCLRLIYGVRRRDHITPALQQSGWLNMNNRAQIHMACFFFKIMKYGTPAYLLQRLTYRTDVHNLNLRRRALLTVPQHKKQIFKRSFSYNISHVMNSISFSLEQSPTTFKKQLKRLLLQSQN